MLEKIHIDTRKRSELFDVTAIIAESIRRNTVKNGVCVIYTPHTTAGIMINENADPDVKSDIIFFLNKLIPQDKGFAHCEGNSDAHIKSAVCGNSKTVFIEDGNLVLGRWEGIYFAEFDGPRKREIWLKIISG